jgi:beta-N-acetylhexosaminidase
MSLWDFKDKQKGSGVKEIVSALQKGYIQGVILFSYNISSSQLKFLTSFLKKKGCKIIAVDQEGGRVSRLNQKNGFPSFPSAKEITELKIDQVRKHYKNMAELLKDHGITFVFGPCVDLDKGSSVISGLERSYGETPQKVIKYAAIFLEEFKKVGIKTCLKHFSGHSEGDTHKGFVVKRNWSSLELIPYKHLKADSIMVAHTLNPYFDKVNPESLSPKVISYIRQNLHFKEDIVADDLCMGAMLAEYSFKDVIKKAIKAGNTILIVGRHPKAFDVDIPLTN